MPPMTVCGALPRSRAQGLWDPRAEGRGNTGKETCAPGPVSKARPQLWRNCQRTRHELHTLTVHTSPLAHAANSMAPSRQQAFGQGSQSGSSILIAWQLS